jgi:hypothetical protein
VASTYPALAIVADRFPAEIYLSPLTISEWGQNKWLRTLGSAAVASREVTNLRVAIGGGGETQE